MISNADFLLGSWRFTREIRHSDGQIHLVDGAASLTRKGKDLVYAETGVLRIGAQNYSAERRYIWRPRAGGFDVYFDDGRFFHSFEWESAEAAHFCDPDQYEVRYQFGDEEWQSKWRVKGPRKDYVMETRYIAI